MKLGFENLTEDSKVTHITKLTREALLSELPANEDCQWYDGYACHILNACYCKIEPCNFYKKRK